MLNLDALFADISIPYIYEFPRKIDIYTITSCDNETHQGPFDNIDLLRLGHG